MGNNNTRVYRKPRLNPMFTTWRKHWKPNKDINMRYKNTLTRKGEERLKAQFTKRLARHIKKARKEKKTTQEQLAFDAGLNSAYIGHLERGVYSPTLYVVWKLSQALKINLSGFLKEFPS